MNGHSQYGEGPNYRGPAPALNQTIKKAPSHTEEIQRELIRLGDMINNLESTVTGLIDKLQRAGLVVHATEPSKPYPVDDGPCTAMGQDLRGKSVNVEACFVRLTELHQSLGV
jgi:hypothetical protein